MLEIALCGTVEVAVAKHQPAGAENGALELGQRLGRAPELLRGVADQRIVLVVHRAGRPWGVCEGDALGEDPRDAGGLRGRHQIPRALGAQAVGECEVPLDRARVDAWGNRRELVDDGVGAGLRDGT